jgi:hypothetical protein
MSEVTLFKNSHGNCAVVVTLPTGAVETVPFVSGKFFTTNKVLESVLLKAAETREFGVYVDKNETSIDPEYATPMDQMRKKIRDELIAQMKANPELLKDMGISAPAPLSQSLTNTTGIVGAAELTEAEDALKQKQIQELANPQTENKQLSAAELLAKVGKQ